MSKLNVGDKAPDFVLKDHMEKEVSLKDFKGKWVVLYFYPKDNTPGCSTEAMEFTAKLDDFKKLNCEILGVSPDSCLSHQKFIAKKNLNITLLSDAEKIVLGKYGVWQLKKMCGREYMGVVRTTFLINQEGKIAHIWNKVRVKGHVDAVIAKLQEFTL
jgi:peroxiredoxin Q/BCP